jgi:hypothetical protein
MKTALNVRNKERERVAEGAVQATDHLDARAVLDFQQSLLLKPLGSLPDHGSAHAKLFGE